jgi:hypothetical protein
MLRFDWTITSGNVLTIIGFFIAAVGAYQRLVEKWAQTDKKVATIEAKLNILYGLMFKTHRPEEFFGESQGD